MPAQAKEEEHRIELRRRFAATRAEVFAAWTEEKALRQWFSPPGYTCDLAEVDLMEGVIELEHYGVPFSRTDDGKIYVAGNGATKILEIDLPNPVEVPANELMQVFLAFGIIAFRQFLSATGAEINSVSDLWAFANEHLWRRGFPGPHRHG